MTSERVTVIDVGGTHFRSAQWSPSEGLGPVQRFSSPSCARFPGVPVPELQARLVAAIAQTVPCDGLAGVSVGAALNQADGTVYASAPLWGAHSRPLALLDALRESRPDVRWHVLNDVTAGVVHFAHTSAGPGTRKVMAVTISTGIAARIMAQDGRIPFDVCGLQGEVGHLPVQLTVDDEPVRLDCDCGERDHLAAFSSGRAIPRVAAVLRERDPKRWAACRLGRNLDGGEPFEQVFSAALDANDPVAGTLLEAVTRPIADLIRTTLCLDPEIDLIGLTGGVVSGLREHYRSAVVAHLSRAGVYLTSDLRPDWLPGMIRICPDGEADPLVGAGLAAQQAQNAETSYPRSKVVFAP